MFIKFLLKMVLFGRPVCLKSVGVGAPARRQEPGEGRTKGKWKNMEPMVCTKDVIKTFKTTRNVISCYVSVDILHRRIKIQVVL